MGHRTKIWLAVAVAAVTTTLLATASAHAAFGIKAFDGQVTANAAGDPFTQAGGHPYSAWTAVEYNSVPDPYYGIFNLPEGNAKDILVDLPPGIVGNPTVLPKCALDEFFSTPSHPGCDPDTQVGLAKIKLSVTGAPVNPFALFNMEPAPGQLAQFAFKAANVPVFLSARLRASGDYSLSIDAERSAQGLQFYGAQIELWGNPADPVNDRFRCQDLFPDPDYCNGPPGDDESGPNAASYRPVPFLTNPTACTAPGVGLTTSLRTDSWQEPGVYHEASFESHLPAAYPELREAWGPPQGPTGCDQVPFDPAAAVSPDNARAGSPAGLGVDLSLPQDGLTELDGIATAHLRTTKVELPDGMAINPAAANGLEACSDEQMAFGSDTPVACPGASQIGTAWATTPLLEERIEGALYLGTQRSDDPGSGEMFRAFLVLENEQRGLLVKLRGQVRLDERTGRVVATFADNPQLPVDRIHVQIDGGDRAPLTNPAACGTPAARVSLTPWSTDVAQVRDTPFAVDQGCGAEGAFDPAFAAGTESPVAGEFSPFHARVQRDRGKELGRIDVKLPKGLVAVLKRVDLCTNGQIAAAAGRDGRATQGAPACPANSQIGTTTVGAGAGSTPYYPVLPGGEASGRVFLTEGYKGAPYGLAIEVPAVAGPFDLGTVMVRAAVHVDPETAQLSVVSDQLPAIVKGVPLNMRDVRVDVDRPRFTVNPTSCTETKIAGDIAAQDGTGVTRSTPFEVGDCASLPLTPRVAMSVVGRGKTKLGANPALRVRLRQPAGQSNLRTVKTTLPLSMALDARNTSDPKLLCGYDAALKADCPASSVIGKAKAVSPLLKRPLAGPVHLVQGIKFGPKGNRIRTTPTLLVKLAGEVKINVRARTTATNDRLVTTFDRVPDAAVSDFRLNLAGGEKKGILTVTRGGLCQKAQNAKLAIRGHNGKLVRPTVRMKTPCGKRR